MNSDRTIETLTNSLMFQKFERAYSETSGFPVMKQRIYSDRFPPIRGVRRKPIRLRLPGIVIFQIGNTLSSSLASEFKRQGVILAQVSPPFSDCSDRDFIEKRMDGALAEVGQIELVLAFVDDPGLSGEISISQPRASLSAALESFLEAVFKAGKQVRQVCVLTYSGEAQAIAGLEVMVKLYAAEQGSTHFSMIALHKPWTQRADEEHLAETITTALCRPTGVVLDEHGNEWQIVHKMQVSEAGI